MSDPTIETATPEAEEDGRSASSSTLASLAEASLFLNRELSWLDFNDRVLQLAEDESLPLMERVKFLAIFVTNLDEFFMVRVAGVHDQVDARIDARGPDGLSPTQVLAGIAERVTELDRRHARQFTEVVRPELAEHGIRIVSCEESDAPDELIARHFREQIFPVLTPLAIGPGRPFPYISNLSLSLIVRLHDPDLDHEVYARVKVPKEVLPRFVEISPNTFIPLEQIIARHLDALFPGWRSSATTCSGSPATPTSRSPTRPTTSSRRSRTSSGAGASARSCDSRSARAWIPRCAPG